MSEFMKEYFGESKERIDEAKQASLGFKDFSAALRKMENMSNGDLKILATKSGKKKIFDNVDKFDYKFNRFILGKNKILAEFIATFELTGLYDKETNESAEYVEWDGKDFKYDTTLDY